MIPHQFELDEPDYALRGRLLRSAFGTALGQMRFGGRTTEEVQQAVDEGRFTVLVDDQGKFIKNSFIPLTPQAGV